MRIQTAITGVLAGVVLALAAHGAPVPRVLPGSEPLRIEQDWREGQRRQIINYLQRRIARTPALRDREWSGALASPAAFSAFAARQRSRLADMVGFANHGTYEASTRSAPGAGERSEWVELIAADGFGAAALVLRGSGPATGRAWVAAPPVNTPAERFAASDPFVRRATETGDTVAVLVAVPRDANHPLAKKLSGFDRRRILHRLAFVVGTTLPGMEAAQACLIAEHLRRSGSARVSMYGREQGGMTAMLAAAIDTRFDGAVVADYFQAREGVADEPVDRAIYGQLLHFGDAEIAALIAPRRLEIVEEPAPRVELEFARARRYYSASGRDRADALLLSKPQPTVAAEVPDDPATVDRNFERLHQYLRSVIERSEAVRSKRWGLTAAAASGADKGERVRKDLASWMGVPSDPPTAMHPRSRLLLITDRFAAYEVVIEALDGLEVYGHLLVPREQPGRLPAVVCQHGLGGQPSDITGVGAAPNVAYHEFGRRLAERGYVVFAPYVTVPIPQADLINPIVRRAAALGMMRTALEVRKLSRVVDFLQTLPMVNPARIGYYGLSYGGYSTLWMGPLETRIRAVIVSGHFNDWRAKITNEELRTSYMMHPDEDFFNFDVLHRFTHPELIAAMLPRAVMVEFAEKDATTTPEWHDRAWGQAVEIARALGYSDRLARDRFEGVHEIGGMRTMDWLDRWLKPEQASARDYTYRLWPSGRDLPGLADNAEDTYPFHRLEFGAGSGILRDAVRVGSGRTLFEGIGIRLSRSGRPPAVVVRYGTREGQDDLGRGRIEPDTVHPLYDLWYEARVKPVAVQPGRMVHVEIALERSGGGEGTYTMYGPKPLGGRSRPMSFYFAYKLLGPDGAKPKVEPAFEFVRPYLNAPADPVFGRRAKPRNGEIQIDSGWSLQPAGVDDVEAAAADGFRTFLRSCCGVRLEANGSRRIALQISGTDPRLQTSESFHASVGAGGITLTAQTSRGLMRALYWLQDEVRAREGPFVPAGETTRNERFERRITTSILPGGMRYREASHELLYTSGLLRRMSRDGFNAVWVWLNTEEAADGSRIFPELEDPQAGERLRRIQRLTEEARRYGIDVYVYLATGYHHFIPDSFYAKYPEVKGYGFGSPMCTSDARVRRYQAEIVENIAKHAPGIKGLIVIYDHEGFYYCGNTESHRQQCPRCRNSTSEALALQVIENLSGAWSRALPGKEFIAWSYGTEDWVDRVIPLLPKGVKVQVDFSKGGVVERDGVVHRTGDYNLTLIGPPDFFERRAEASARLGLDFIIKTEHAVSQEFIFVPYIPAMDQWRRRIEKMRQYPSAGWFGNWSHYGYLASLPAQLINRMSFDPQPEGGTLLRDLARVNYGENAVPLVLQAWDDFSEGIRQFPYSDAVSRLPGPLQKGPSHPLFLDPAVKSFGAWRSWQNDLNWTRPWGPEVARKYLTIVRDRYRMGAESLRRAAAGAGEASHREALNAEWRIARTIECSLTSTIHLIDWIQVRDAFHVASGTQRAGLGAKLRAIAESERANAVAILPVLDSDSRIGYASEGGGVMRGGLFTPDLVRWKIGQIDDVLERQLPEALQAGQ